MTDRYSVDEEFDLLTYSDRLVACLDSKRVVSARKELCNEAACRIIVSNGSHKCIVNARKCNKCINISVKEDVNSAFLNIGTVIAATIVGFVSGKSKAVGKSFLGVAGYKLFDNMLHKTRLEETIEKFTLDYLEKQTKRSDSV